MDCKNTIIDDVILNTILKLDKSILSHQKKTKDKRYSKFDRTKE